MIKEAVEEIWSTPSKDAQVDTWASRMEEVEKSRQINPVERVVKPDLSLAKDWKIDLYHLR